MLLATGAGGDGVPGAGVAGTPTGSEAAPPPEGVGALLGAPMRGGESSARPGRAARL